MIFRILLVLLALLPQVALAQTCPITQTTPAFTAGGNLFGRIAAQWNSYFAAKVDANNGVLCNPTIIGGTSGPVSSVGLSAPNIFSVAGSPITSSGTLALTLTTQTANTFFAGPASGGVAEPAFRVIATADVTGKLACADLSNDGTGCTANAANPTATAGVAAVNGVATTYMRSDAAPAVSLSCADLSNDGAGCTANAANPTATIGTSAVNGSATTYMRSDAAPVVPAAAVGTAGIAKLHNTPVAVGWPAALNPNNIVLANVLQASTISGIVGAVETATGAAATVSVFKVPSGTACSAGTVLHSGSFDANGTPATNQTLTVTVAALAAGDRVCLQTTGTTSWTGGTGIGTITVFLAPS